MSIPKKLKKYEIGSQLGSGSYGVVYLCKNKSKELLVIKTIQINGIETVSLNVEVAILRKLKHQHVLKFFDSFIAENFLCIVTEYCKLGDLDEYIKRQLKNGHTNTNNDRPRLGTWMYQIVHAIHYLHSKKILHRDLKTKNIFLRQSKTSRPNSGASRSSSHSGSSCSSRPTSGKQKHDTHYNVQDLPDMVLGDFGVAKVLQDATANRMASTFIGTPFYMSPEQLNHSTYSKAADVWAAGCVFFEMIDQKRAINASTMMQCMIQVSTGKTPVLENENFEDWQEIINGMLQKSPHFRSSTSELLQRFSYFSPDCTISVPQNQQKSLTPKERMMLRKKQNADKRARELVDLSENRRQEIKLYSESGKQHTLSTNLDILSLSDGQSKTIDSDPYNDTIFDENYWEESKENEQNLANLSFESEDTYFDEENDLKNESSLVQGDSLNEFYEYLAKQNDDYEDDFEENETRSTVKSKNSTIVALDTLTQTIEESSMLVADQIMLERINRLKQKCVEVLGENLFNKVYLILLDNQDSENANFKKKLKDLIPNDSDCMWVDQLIYLEKECGFM